MIQVHPKEKTMKKNLLKTIFSGIAVAMGVASIVMNILGVLSTGTAINLLSLGLTALAIAALQK
jgi:hypothetical protein